MFRTAAVGLLVDAAFARHAPFHRLLRHRERAIHITGPFHVLFDIPVCNEHFVADAPDVHFADCDEQCLIAMQLSPDARARLWLVTADRYQLFRRRLAGHIDGPLLSEQKAGRLACIALDAEIRALTREAASDNTSVVELSHLPQSRIYLTDLHFATMVPLWLDMVGADRALDVLETGQEENAATQ